LRQCGGQVGDVFAGVDGHSPLSLMLNLLALSLRISTPLAYARLASLGTSAFNSRSAIVNRRAASLCCSHIPASEAHRLLSDISTSRTAGTGAATAGRATGGVRDHTHFMKSSARRQSSAR